MSKAKEKTVEFKSTPENYEKEKSGVKNNTVRRDDDSDCRFVELRHDCQIDILSHPKGRRFQ